MSSFSTSPMCDEPQLLARIRDVSVHSCDVITEIVRDGLFPFFEIVLSVLCQRYGVLDFLQLQCGGPANIPALNALLYVQTKVQPWISAQLAVRSTLCIADLDYECYQFLRQLGVTAVIDSGANNVKSDPCEVDLDADEPVDRDQQEWESFEYFGLGPLQRHPLLAAYFHPSLALRDCIGSECVLQHLLDYLSDQRSHHGGVNRQAFSCDDFVQYLCSELSVNSLHEVGVCIRGDLCAERLALQHVVQQRYKLFVEVAKKELEHFNQQMSAMEGNNDTKRNQGRKKRRKQAIIESESMEEEPRSGTEDAVNAQQDEGRGAEEAAVEGTPCEEGAPVAVSSPAQHETTQRSGAESSRPTIAPTAVVEAAGSTLQTPSLAGSASVATAAEKPPAVYADSGFETKMRIYTADAASSDGAGWGPTPTGADIYTIETGELQGCLPFLPAPDATAEASSIEAAGALDSRAAGRWGEALVHQYLLSRRGAGCTVHWLNEQEESRAAYDFTVSAPCGRDADLLRASHMHNQASSSSSSLGSATGALPGVGRSGVRTEYVEVKTTRFGDRNVFELSPFEWQFAAAEPRVPYHIYRVFAAGDPARVRILVVRDVYDRVLEGRVKLCLAT